MDDRCVHGVSMLDNCPNCHNSVRRSESPLDMARGVGREQSTTRRIEELEATIEEKNREIEFRDGTILGCEAIEFVLTRDNEEMKAFILGGYCPSANGFKGPQSFPDCGECVYCKIKRGEEPWLK